MSTRRRRPGSLIGPRRKSDSSDLVREFAHLSELAMALCGSATYNELSSGTVGVYLVRLKSSTAWLIGSIVAHLSDTEIGTLRFPRSLRGSALGFGLTGRNYHTRHIPEAGQSWDDSGH